ncbi:hypothetical protein ACS0TY_024390 [Phlomoides rotata]
MEGTLPDVKITRQAPAVSHLFFADDIIMFFRATLPAVDKVKEIISDYERA